MAYKMLRGDTVLIHELARGAGKEEAAEEAGVSYGTVLSRSHNKEFMALVETQRHNLLDQTAGILIDASGAAASFLWDLVDDETVKEYVRRAAATDILNFTLRTREILNLEERLMRLESELYDEP